MTRDGDSASSASILRFRIDPLNRRTLLFGAVTALPVAFGASALLHGDRLFAASAPAAAPKGFLALSRMLANGRMIDGALADAGWAALVAREKDFPARLDALQKAVAAAGLHDMTGWKTSTVAADPALKATAVAIVGAWYLGRVGAVQDRSEDGPNFITYSGALMWAPTIDVTVIPTFARGRPGFWFAKPVPATPA